MTVTNDDLRKLGTWESPDGSTQWTDNPDGTITMSPSVGEPLTFLLHSRRDAGYRTPLSERTRRRETDEVPEAWNPDDGGTLPPGVDPDPRGFPQGQPLGPADGTPVLVDGAHRAICRGPVTGEPALSWVDLYRSSLVVPDRLRMPTRRLTPHGTTT